MPTTIKVKTRINKKSEEVFKCLKNLDCFPRFVKNIKKLETSRKGLNSIISSWEIEIEGTRVVWKEENFYDDKAMVMKFKMLEGDYKEYKGTWSIGPYHDGCQVLITAYFDWGLPAFEPFVGKILEKKAKFALKGMLEAIKRELQRK